MELAKLPLGGNWSPRTYPGDVTYLTIPGVPTWSAMAMDSIARGKAKMGESASFSFTRQNFIPFSRAT
jgi:hypothetical protein